MCLDSNFYVDLHALSIIGRDDQVSELKKFSSDFKLAESEEGKGKVSQGGTSPATPVQAQQSPPQPQVSSTGPVSSPTAAAIPQPQPVSTPTDTDRITPKSGKEGGPDVEKLSSTHSGKLF